jgi:hypothetical protein
MESTELEQLERRLRGLREDAMRRAVVLEVLRDGDAERAYALVRAVLHRPEARAPSLPHLRRTLNEVLVEGGPQDPLDYPLRAALYAEATANDDRFVMRLLRSPDAVESMADPLAALPRAVAEIPLGTRRALAKGLDKGLLDRLMLDPDPIVIANVLENARITEDDVVRLAGRRPMPGSSLVQIHRSRRFGMRPRVCEALAYNPYCPTDVAIELIGSLRLGALRRIARDATLHPELRSQAGEEIERRSPGGGAADGAQRDRKKRS